MSDTKNVYGIDLGTTYSAIATVNEYGKAEIIKNAEGDVTTPSVVFFESEGRVAVGKTAKESGKAGPEESQRVVDFVKREMHNSAWVREFDGKSYNPVEVSSLILRKLVEDAKSQGFDVKDAVITCPAYFDPEQRKKTQQAGEIIGLNVLMIIDEPIAAATSYALDKNIRGKSIIVYDLGGGTFDVTVVSVGDGDNPEIRVVCARGDHELGGKDWDKIISDHYVAEFESATEKSISPDEEPEEYHEVIYDLKLRAETDKQLLTAKDKVTANIKFGSERHKVELSRAQFDDLTKEKLAATFTLTDELLARNKELGEKSPDVWLLVGGSTRMRQVHEKLAERYSLTEGENLIEWEPSEAVAKGAALIAKILIDNPAQAPDSNGDTPALPGHTKPQHKGPSFVCIATHTYGVECLKNGSNTDTWVSNLIERDTPIPQGGVLSKKKRFGVAADGTTQLSLRVFENGDTVEFTEISQSKALKDAVNGEEILFDLPQALNTGSPIDIRLDLDEQGILSLFAEDPVSGASKEARFEVGLSQKDVDEAKKKIGGLVSAE